MNTKFTLAAGIAALALTTGLAATAASAATTTSSAAGTVKPHIVSPHATGAQIVGSYTWNSDGFTGTLVIDSVTNNAVVATLTDYGLTETRTRRPLDALTGLGQRSRHRLPWPTLRSHIAVGQRTMELQRQHSERRISVDQRGDACRQPRPVHVPCDPCAKKLKVLSVTADLVDRPRGLSGVDVCVVVVAVLAEEAPRALGQIEVVAGREPEVGEVHLVAVGQGVVKCASMSAKPSIPAPDGSFPDSTRQ
jgi:hypothetical protein